MRHPSAIVSGVRRLASKGWTVDAIARVYRMPRADVRAILDPPPRPVRLASSDPTRPIRGGLAMACRRRHARGDSAEAIASALKLRAGDVAAYLASVDALASRRAWLLSAGPECRDDGQGDVIAPPIAEAAAGKLAAAEAPEPSTPSAIVAGHCGVWGSIHASTAAGGRAGNAALSDADAEVIRQLRARGVARRDLADRFGVSPATITRITRGETYRASDVAEVAPEPTMKPQILPAQGPEPTVWTEPTRRGPEWRDD